MKIDADGLPMVGNRFGMLGVRTPKDIAVDTNGQVHPESGGLSVERDIEDVPFDPSPKFRIFEAPRELPESLVFREDKPGHVNSEPATTCTIEEFQRALASTRADWVPIPEADDDDNDDE